MKLLGNIIWIVFGGLLLALEYAILGLFWCITIIGIPIGIQLFKCASLSLWPFGREVRHKQQATGCLSTGMNLIWIILGGLLLALQHAILGLFFCITIIGIPFGMQHFKLAAIALTPFGKEIMSSKKIIRVVNNQKESKDSLETVNKQPAPPVNGQESDLAVSEVEDNSIISSGFNSPMSDMPVDKRKLYIGGGVLAALLICGGIWYFYSGSPASGTFAGKPIEEIFPKVLKVVEVDAGTANLRTGPSTESTIALDPMNAQDGVKYVANKGTRLVVMEDMGEWYKLALKDRNGDTTYIKKSLCRDLITGIIPQEKVYTDWFNQDSECGGGVSVVRQPKGNRLVVSYTHVECDADELLLGVYQDGVYLFYYSIPVTSLVYKEHNTGISIKKLPDESIFYDGYYGKDMTRKVNYEWEDDEVLDWAKVPEEKLAEIFSLAISDGSKIIKVLTARDIEETQNQKSEEDSELTGFSYVVDGDENGLELYAEVGDKKVPTGIAGGAKTLDIIHQGDYDGDGEKEALVFEWGGGNAVEPPYLVYYDKDTKEFKKVEGIEDVYNDSSIDIEDWNGKSTFLAKVGLRRDRYVYEYHQLKQVERVVPDVGKRIATITVKQLFGDDESIEEKTANIDINGDGRLDEVTFQHNTSHAMDWGKSMLLVGINLGEQVLDLSDGSGVSGGTFSFLESATNGIPDILCDDAWLHKWNGEKYESQE